jgi:hypothetical protein
MLKVMELYKITAKTKKDLMQEYKISMPTLNIWLSSIKGLGKPKGYFYTPKQVKMIYKKYGNPNTSS